MFRHEIHEGNTIITKPDRKGISVTGVVTSTRGTKKCSVTDANGTDWGIPYEMIIACSATAEPVKVVMAKEGDTILHKDGERYRIKRVNSTRYTATRLSDGKDWYVPFHHVVEILNKKDSTAEAQKAFLASKGFSAKDVAEFEALFLS